MFTNRLVIAAVMVVMLAAPVHAQEKNLLEDQIETLALTLGEGETFQLPQSLEEVAVVDPAVADVVVGTPTRLHILARGVGETDIILAYKTTGQSRKIHVRVSANFDAVDEALKTLLPDARIKVEAVKNAIYLHGTVRDPSTATTAEEIARRYAASDADVINMIDVLGRHQVHIRARISEVQRSVLKELGINTSFSSEGGSWFLAPWVADSVTTDAVLPILPGLDTAIRGLQFDKTISGDSFTAIMNALERNGLVKTLAQPNLTAISGETANMLAGGEFPILIPQSENVTIEFKEFGILLGFTPTVVGDGRINLKLSVEVSSLSSQNSVNLAGFDVPSLIVRRTNTVVDLPSGGTIAIAGLLQNDIRNEIQGFPGLMHVPVLGQLFSSKSFQRNETELVITITAYMVKPVGAEDMAAPIDGFAAPTDLDLHLMNRLHTLYADRKPEVPEALYGHFGYILE